MHLRHIGVKVEPSDRIAVYAVPENHEVIVDTGDLSLSFPSTREARAWALRVSEALLVWQAQQVVKFVEVCTQEAEACPGDDMPYEPDRTAS